MPTCERETDLVYYPGVRDYALPTDFTGTIMPKRPDDLHSDTFSHQTSKSFAHWPYGNITAVKWSRETPYFEMNSTDGSPMKIQECESLTENGTWTISGDSGTVAVDKYIYSQGVGSLQFTVTPSSGTTTLTCTGFSAVDITDILTSGRLFLDLQPPSTNSTALTSVTLRIGSSASNYYEISATTRQRGDTILNGWGIIGFDPSTKTTTGTPDSTSTTYLQVIINHGLTGVSGVYHLDNIFASFAKYFQLPYYSKYNVKDVSGNYKERITATDDTVLCPSDFDEVFTYKTLEMVAAMRLRDANMANYFRGELAPKERWLKTVYPQMQQKINTFYYKNAGKF